MIRLLLPVVRQWFMLALGFAVGAALLGPLLNM